MKYVFDMNGGGVMKVVHTYVCLVDGFRNGEIFRDKKDKLYDRNTKERYLVGAKTEKEAISLLREAIGFGSIQVYYRATNDSGEIKSVYQDTDVKMEYKRVAKVEFVEGKVNLTEPRKTTDPMEQEEDNLLQEREELERC